MCLKYTRPLAWSAPVRGSAPLCPRLPVPTGPRAPPPVRPPRTHVWPRPLCTRATRWRRHETVGMVLPPPTHGSNAGPSPRRRAARAPRSLRPWETPGGRCRTGHRLRRREEHPRRAPVPAHLRLPPATPSGLLTLGTGTDAAPGGGRAVGRVSPRLTPAAARGTATRRDHDAPDTPESPPQAPPAADAAGETVLCLSGSPRATCRAPRTRAAQGRWPTRQRHDTDAQREKRAGGAAHPTPTRQATARGGHARRRTRHCHDDFQP